MKAFIAGSVIASTVSISARMGRGRLELLEIEGWKRAIGAKLMLLLSLLAPPHLGLANYMLLVLGSRLLGQLVPFGPSAREPDDELSWRSRGLRHVGERVARPGVGVGNVQLEDHGTLIAYCIAWNSPLLRLALVSPSPTTQSLTSLAVDHPTPQNDRLGPEARTQVEPWGALTKESRCLRMITCDKNMDIEKQIRTGAPKPGRVFKFHRHHVFFEPVMRSKVARDCPVAWERKARRSSLLSSAISPLQLTTLRNNRKTEPPS
ncbi:hypothetical protein BD779DRAFT_1477393 [Infundibulicybe gibba]|nr:hypothetical protein BD779DRAFT_1477393 [Infundibulicybe gibba]